jgi:hypothetical protein
MWTLEPRTEFARAVGAGLFLAAVALFVMFQEVGLALRREEQRAWWAGSGRDVLNAIGVAAVAATLRVFGYPLAAAIFCAGTLTLLLFGTSMWFETRGWRSGRVWALCVGWLAGIPLLVAAGPLVRALAGVTERLFPHAP